MKKTIATSILVLLAAAWSHLGAQDWPDEYLGLPGDNLNLYATMKLFQESQTLEDFEKALNDENSRINNLDLNNDNLVDYIMVNDFVDGNVHNIVLRVAMDRKETQDVAVFVVEQMNNGAVQIQLIGDEALYGRNYIVEPYYDDQYGETPNPGYSGNVRNVEVVRTTTYEVSAWPVVRFLFMPRYVAWHSAWYWGYRPSYWNPWRPYYWHYYYGYHSSWYNHYYSHYRPWHYPRYSRYNDFYCIRIRSHSPLINININKGVYKNSYSRPESRREGEALYARDYSGRNGETRRPSAIRDGQGRSSSRSAVNPGVAASRPADGRRTQVQSGSRTGDSPVMNRNQDASVSGRRSQGTVQEPVTTGPRTKAGVVSDRSTSDPGSSRPATMRRTTTPDREKSGSAASSARSAEGASRPAASGTVSSRSGKTAGQAASPGRSSSSGRSRVEKSPSVNHKSAEVSKPSSTGASRQSSKGPSSRVSSTSRSSSPASSGRVSSSSSSSHRSSSSGNSSGRGSSGNSGSSRSSRR